jgi:hypothetical protein
MRWQLWIMVSLGCEGKEKADTSGVGSAPPSDTSAPIETGEPPLIERWAVSVLPSDGVSTVDECGTFCATVTVTHDGEPVADAVVDVWIGLDCIGADLRTDALGAAQVCTTALDVGENTLLATLETMESSLVDSVTLDVRPFGYADGIVRDARPLDAMPYLPSFARHTLNPVLSPGIEGSFDSAGAMLPSVAPTDTGWVMWYAGTTDEDYTVGVATSPDGLSWTQDSGVALGPSGVEGSWKRYATNSPMIVSHGDGWRVYYTGRADPLGDLNIGLAEGTTPTEVVDLPESPVFRWVEEEESWSGPAVAHPAVVQHPDGHWEMLYSTGYHRIGHAQSLDGVEWNRYCKNPVFVGRGGDSWEQSQVKSADIVVHDGVYLMTYTGGDRGQFKIGFAASRDGLSWTRMNTPILGPSVEPGTWESGGVLGAALAVDGDQLKMWYAGTGVTGSAIGLATATLPASIGEVP